MFRAESFRIIVPTVETFVKQGEVQTVTVWLNRGEDFKQDVWLEAKASKGLSVEPAITRVGAGDKPEVQLRIEAPKAAALGDYHVYLKGKPEKGESASVDFKVKVLAR